MRAVALLLTLPLLLTGTFQVDALAQQKVEIREWNVPWADSRPGDPYVDARGRVWFVGQTADYVAMRDPETGQFTRYDLEKGAGPHNLIVDKGGIVWYAGNTAAHIGRLDPATKAIRKIAMPDAGIIVDPQGRPWFNEFGTNKIDTVDPATMTLREYEDDLVRNRRRDDRARSTGLVRQRADP